MYKYIHDVDYFLVKVPVSDVDTRGRLDGDSDLLDSP